MWLAARLSPLLCLIACQPEGGSPAAAETESPEVSTSVAAGSGGEVSIDPSTSGSSSGDGAASASAEEDGGTTSGSESGSEGEAPTTGDGSGTTSSSGSTGETVCDVSGSWEGEGSYYDAFDMMEHAVPVSLELEQHDEAPEQACFLGGGGDPGLAVTGTYNGNAIQQGAFRPDTRELCIRYNNYYVVSMAQLSAGCDSMEGNWATEGWSYDYEVERVPG